MAKKRKKSKCCLGEGLGRFCPSDDIQRKEYLENRGKKEKKRIHKDMGGEEKVVGKKLKHERRDKRSEKGISLYR